MQLVTSLNVLYDYTEDVPRCVRRLAAAGFDALDFNGCDMLPAWRGHDGDRYIDQLAATAEECGTPFVQAHGPMFDYFGEHAERGVAETRLCLEWCGRLGVSWMVMHPATVPGPWDAAHDAANLEANLAFFRQFFPLMEQTGVGIAIENLSDIFRGRSFGNTPSDLVTLCDALDHELIGLCWDTGHAKLQKLPQRTAIAALGSRLKAIHVQDNDGAKDQHLMPYHAQVEWDEVIAGLRGAGYAGPWTYEVHNAVRHLPDVLRDKSLELLVAVGRYHIAQFEA